MKVVAYLRRSPEPEAAEAELADQRRTVAEWLAEKGGLLVGEAIEIERGGVARPAFGQAKRRAIEAEAVILVASTRGIGRGGTFLPKSPYQGPAVYVINDIGKGVREAPVVETESEPQSELLVFYLRDFAGLGMEADQSLAWQRTAAEAYVRTGRREVVATFVEDEGRDASATPERPMFSAALAVRDQHGARLVLGTSDTVQGGKPFFLRLAGTPPVILDHLAANFAERIAPPRDLPFPVALHLGSHEIGWRRAVYLVNATSEDLRVVVLKRSGWTLGFGDLAVRNPFEVRFDELAAGSGRLVATYDPNIDCDYRMTWQLSARDANGQAWSGSLNLPGEEWKRAKLGFRNWARVDLAGDPAG